MFRERVALYRLIRIRHRYLFTRGNRLRLRYFVGTAVIVSMMATSLLGAMGSSVAFVPKISEMEIVSRDISEPTAQDEVLASVQTVLDMNQDDVVEPEVVEKPEDRVAALYIPDSYLEVEQQEDISGDEVLNDVVASLDKMFPREEVLKINTGDTMAGVLQNIGVNGADAYKIVKAMSKHYDPRSIKAGQAIQVMLEAGEQGVELSALNMKLSAIEALSVLRDDRGRYVSEIEKKEVVLTLKAAKTTIDSSLYASAARAGIPASVVAEMIRIYSYEVDFQRDIRSGDKVEVLYEIYETEDGDFARYGSVLFADLAVAGDSMPVYRYEVKAGVGDYFHADGQSMKRTLMQTPIDGARMSSGYGMRRHPVLGYNKMHKGIDFAASRGTPIYAAGDGVIEKAGRNGGYGNYIRIRHNGSLKTAYAHMKKFAKGMKSGKRVKQGDVIGYVGTTGRSTGPHLHFEVLKKGKQVNPKSIKSSSGQKLTGKSLSKFKDVVVNVSQKYATLSSGLEFAQNDASE